MDTETAPPPTAPQAPPTTDGVNRFAFVIHPLNVEHIHKHYPWARLLPDALVEGVAARMPPMYLARMTGGRSPATGQRIEGFIFTIGGTPRQIMNHGERFTYTRLLAAAKMAQKMGARIMGLGAFTKVVGDAGMTVARESDLPITSGNSLTVAATLEAAKQAVVRMGVKDLTRGRAMIVGATGAIGSVCSRLIAAAIRDVVLVSIEPERLAALKQVIETETPGAQVVTATSSHDLIGECDLVVTATSAFGQRVIDISQCKPGAVICDVALPSDISAAEGALRPDVLVVEGGEVLIPGPIDFHYDIGLPPGAAYACLAEAALLAMEGRFEDYTLGRNIEIGKVKEMYRLFQKHGYKIAGLRSFGKYVTDEELAAKRVLADRLRQDPEELARVKAEAQAKLEKIPPMSKGVPANGTATKTWWGALAAAGMGAGALALLHYRRRRISSTA